MTPKKRFLMIAILLVLSASISFYFHKKAYSTVKIGGDVYSGGELKDIEVEEKSIMSASGAVDVAGDQVYKIGGYDLTKLKNAMDPDRVNAVIEKLDKIAHESINNFGQITTNNLNSKSLPEGTIWIKENGDLVINSDVEFNGKGTIIVKNGNLNINGNISYANNNTSVGFIVLGSDAEIKINQSVVVLRGAYFTTGEIKIEGGPAP